MQAPSWADVDQAVLSAVHSCVCWNFPGRDDNALETSQALQSMRNSAILAFASLEIDYEILYTRLNPVPDLLQIVWIQ